ncbi:hypothetical protein SBA1_590012 [Candidatus Sulfotelmatobacter kueseliae]|uniref:Uncharacterized protein n=1 Tax=Candidatus Sulfotelmatobacter kueseliae TaxID=2042962 RepID=A0A2U3L0J9_9BACT|nr:hypothetical protein SBA1_590012 [Candidatus Sulfotelmatobacter kueseliae]
MNSPPEKLRAPCIATLWSSIRAFEKSNTPGLGCRFNSSPPPPSQSPARHRSYQTVVILSEAKNLCTSPRLELMMLEPLLTYSPYQIVRDTGAERLGAVAHDVDEVCLGIGKVHRSFAPLRMTRLVLDPRKSA